ncbi:MAG: 4Fe-4S binding protein, partial [Oscillospiraceae bacterium]|nr:4Fe-4S binding protein [Oscillospiraceae bacterium]
MKRRIVLIDRDKCNGCGACAEACHEGAIGMVDGKAQLLRDDYCDGLGDCLPACPTGAISFEERDAVAYDKEAVEKHMAQRRAMGQAPAHGHGCPGSAPKVMAQEQSALESGGKIKSRLNQWPCQIKLVPPDAGY